jgi:putative nucleotidyltransferase with HDIG domain
MGILRKNQKDKKATSRRPQGADRVRAAKRIFGLQSLFYAFCFVAYTAAIIVVCFVRLSPAGPQIIRNQVARIRIVAEIPFTYQSKILTDQKRDNAVGPVPPVYRLNLDPYRNFERYIQRLNIRLTQLEEELREASPSERVAAIQKFPRSFEPNNGYNLNAEDVAIILNQIADDARAKAIQEGLMVLREVHREGIYNADQSNLESASGQLTRWTIQREDETMAQVEVQSEEEALRFLRINLSALEVPREASFALYRLLRNGLGPNIVYDKAATDARRREVIDSVEPAIVTVEEGQTIIEPGNQVNDFDLEQLTAYRATLKRDSSRTFSFNTLLWERMLMTITILASAMIYAQVGARQLRQNRRPIILSAVVILINLALVRLILEMGEANLLKDGNPTLTAVIPYLAPIALGPIIVTILTGAGPGVYVAALISIFNALMQGNAMPIMLVSFFSSLMGIYLCHGIQVRTRVVRAGAAAGLTMAVCTFFIGLHAALDITVILQQMAVGLGIGVITGIAVVGIIPIFENIFKYTTDISLLELTDFNHPLLRHMQVAAPGSYHHSLMVANLSENAAAAIDANPLACRVCSLFHDIGKTRKPEYFTENQQEGINPHVLQNPSMSALVIKSHVREGVTLARQYKLPKLITDVIEQHHGTTLIQYFYYKALKQKEAAEPTHRTGPGE